MMLHSIIVRRTKAEIEDACCKVGLRIHLRAMIDIHSERKADLELISNYSKVVGYKANM